MTGLPDNASVAHHADGGKLLSPSAVRNKDAIVALLRGVAPDQGRALEIASGTGQHVVAMATAMPDLDWHPSEIAQDRITSINAYASEAGLTNLCPAQVLDASAAGWAENHQPYDLIYLGNLLHLIPEDTAAAIIREAAQTLGTHGTFIIYGPFMRAGQLTSDGDAKFHDDLRAADPTIGYKNDAWVKEVLTAAGLPAIITQNMPANNLAFIAKREA